MEKEKGYGTDWQTDQKSVKSVARSLYNESADLEKVIEVCYLYGYVRGGERMLHSLEYFNP